MTINLIKVSEENDDSFYAAVAGCLLALCAALWAVIVFG